MRKTLLGLGIAFSLLPALAADSPRAEPTRITIECEDMQGVAQDKFGPGAGWQVGRWGHDLYQNMVFGGVWASRSHAAMTDAGDNAAEMTAEFDVPADGAYKVWVKYECPPFFNYAFGVRVEPAAEKGKAALDRVYGLRESAKHFSFMGKPLAGDLYWSWGMDHDAAEGYEAALTRGRWRITLSKVPNARPAGARSIDAVLITSDLSVLSAPRFARYPLLDELRRANRVYFRFRNPAGAAQPICVAWNHWNHRYNDFYTPSGEYRALVRFYDAQGRPLDGGRNGEWTEAIAPGEAGPWCDLGPTMNTESSSPFKFIAFPKGAKVSRGNDVHRTDGPCLPFGVDIALEPDERKIVKSFEHDPGAPALTVLVQPDLHRAEGVAATKKTAEIYAELTAELNREPRLGPLPKKIRLYGQVGTPHSPWMGVDDVEASMALQEASGLNTVQIGSGSGKLAEAVLDWGRRHGGLIERSAAYHHSQDMDKIIKHVRDNGLEKVFHYVSFGDEIGLPAVDVKDPAKMTAFHEFLRRHGETPQSLGLPDWDRVRPLAALSGDVAVQIGVLPQEKKGDAGSLAGLKKLYWYSVEFRNEQGIALFAAKTRALKAALGDAVHTSANLGGMHPFYWMHQASFIEAFKGGAMSLAWTEDYTYCQPETSRLVADFQAAYLRKGASYHDTPMMFYCMPHWPGNNPEQLIQNAVLEWGQNVKDLDFFDMKPDIWTTENFIAWRGGLPVRRAIRTISGMAGLIEDHLVPARTGPTKIAMLLSESSDLWETEGKGQGAVEPGSVATNVSQEERKNLWYALRYAGYRVDHVTERDCADGLLKNYSVLYLCGQNLERKAAQTVREWVKSGGVLFATAGAARKDQLDAPSTDLDEALGRGAAAAYERYRGPLRARLELLFVKPLDEMKLADGRALPVYCSREEFTPGAKAQTLASYRNGRPAWVLNEFGKGRAYYTGTLPGQSWAKAALPVLPQGKGGPHTAPHMTEWLGYDPIAADMVLTPVRSAKIEPDVTVNRRGVVTNRLASGQSTVLTVVNLALEADGELKDVELRVAGAAPVKRAWSCFHPKGSLLKGTENGMAVVALPTLGPADVLILEH
jgi:hypothetical protein